MQVEQPVASYGNPQVEDGYTKIANELLDAIIRHDFSKRQQKVVLFIIRKTYGFNKKSDQMSISQISAGTGLEHSATVKTIKELEILGVVSKQHGSYAQSLGLVKNYKVWGVVSKQHPSVKTTIRGCQNDQKRGVKTTPTKDNPKDNTKETYANFEMCWKEYPKRQGGNSKADALKAYTARIKSGALHSDLLNGTIGYRKYCESSSKLNSEFIKLGSTFYGAGLHYMDFLEVDSGIPDWAKE